MASQERVLSHLAGTLSNAELLRTLLRRGEGMAEAHGANEAIARFHRRNIAC